MDKNEYNLKLQEIDKLVDQGNYAAAAAAADQIDWKRVRNVRTLCLISEIYEAENRYEDSKALLLRAYRRAPVGRAILYRLVEVTIKLKQFDEAIEYYSEYVQAAPNDTGKYILKYKIYRGRGSSVEEQIQILKEYLSQEYNEKYAYELAKLYQEADRIQECLATCDDLVLWFHSGKYVIKALELKMKYASLTPKQQEIYDHRFDAEDEEEEFSHIGQEKQIVSDAAVPSAAAEIIEDTQRTIASEIAQTTLGGSAGEGAEIPAAQESAEEAGSSLSQATQVFEKIKMPGAGETDIASEETIPETEKENAAAAEPENVVEESTAAAQFGKAEDESAEASESEKTEDVTGQEIVPGKAAAQEEDLAAPESERAQEVTPAVPESEDLQEKDEKTFEDQQPTLNTQELQTEMIKSMREIVSGVGLRDMVDEDEEAADRLIEASKREQERQDPNQPAVSMRRKLTMPELERKRDAGQLSIDDILLSMGERGSAVREAVAKASPAAAAKPKPEGVLSAVDEALLSMGISPEVTPKKEKPLDELFRPDTPAPGTEKETQKKVPAAETAWEDMTGEEAAESTASAEAEDYEAETPESTAAGEAAAEDLAAEQTADNEDLFGEEAASEEETEKSAEEITAGDFEPEDDVKIASPPAHKPLTDMEELTGDSAAAPADPEKTGDASQDMTMDEIINAKTRRIPDEEIARRRGQIPPELDAEDTEGEETGETAAGEDRPADGEAAKTSGENESEASDDGKEGKPAEQAKEKTPAPMWVKPHLRGFFDGYLEVRDMDRQISEAIDQAMAKGNDRTSRSGNILIFGGHGCGKTTIATGLAKAIARERGLSSVKMARIYATDLNRKDIAATIAKISGGVLIVEEAGDLEDGIADQLSTAMEFRTDGLIIILEDEQRYMHDLLMRHPRMTMKFTSQIYIPPFTTDDLVRFAGLYADDRDYAISEGAAAVLKSRLDTIAGSQDGPLAITAALDLVDASIVRANKFGRKLFSGKKRYDSEGRIILLEKDMK